MIFSLNRVLTGKKMIHSITLEIPERFYKPLAEEAEIKGAED